MMRIGRQYTIQPTPRPKAVGTGVALCAIGRRENRYAVEWVEHYKSLGFDHIIICDNNHEGEEYFEEVLQPYIDEGYVEIIPCRDQQHVQCMMYAAVYRKYAKTFRWMAFFDFDEFMDTRGVEIHELMKNYEAFDCVLFNWMNFGDNGLLRDDGRPLKERFTEPLPFDNMAQYRGIPDNNHIKCVLRGGLEQICFFENPHIPSSPKIECCDSTGKKVPQKALIPFDFSVAYLRHYCTKTCEEWFTNKWQKGTGNKESIEAFRSKYVGRFFCYNERTPEKEALMRDLTGMPAFHASLHRNVLIVHFNTQRLTDATIRSLNKQTPGCRIIIFDNSDKEPFVNTYDNVEVIDNTKGRVVDLKAMIDSHPDKVPTPENNYGSANHCRSVDVCMDLFPEGFLLMDSDVLVTRDITPFFDDSCAWTGQLQLHTCRFDVTLPRVLPFISYINVPMCRKHGIRYYDDDMMYALTYKKPNVGYDTGCWFYEQCHNAGLPENHVNINEYIIHFGHGSWMGADEAGWLEANKEYWQ